MNQYSHQRFPILNRKGFSLLELMVVTGIMAVVGLGFSQMIVAQLGVMTHVENKLSSLNMRQEITHYMSSVQSCANTLNGLVLPTLGNTINEIIIKDTSNTVRFSATPPNNIYDKLTIRSITLTNLDIGTFPGSGLARLRINAQGNNSDLVLNAQEYVVYVAANAGGSITSCGGGTDCVGPVSPDTSDLRVYSNGETYQKWVAGPVSHACRNNGAQDASLHVFTCSAGQSVIGPVVATRVLDSGTNDCHSSD